MPDLRPVPSFDTSSSIPTSSSSSSTSASRLRINEPTPEFAAIRRASRLARCLMGGTQAMREAGSSYLPLFPDEDRSSWEARLAQTFLFNAYKLAHGVMVGKAFSHPIVLQPDVPSPLARWSENINLRGDHLNVFSQSVFADSLHPGRGYLLVEFPKKPGDLPARPSPEIEAKFNLRPYFSYISADQDMLGIDRDYRNGNEVIRRVRWSRVTTEEDGWGQTPVERVYVWELIDGRVYYTVYLEPPSGSKPDQEWSIEEAGPVLGYGSRPLTRIPLTEFKTGDGPFLDDLAWKNLEHWQSSSDQRNILHVARVIAFLIYGVDKEKWNEVKMPWGPGAAYFFKNKTDAGMEHLVYDGDVTIGERDLAHIEEQLVTLSLEPLLNRPGDMTATAKALDQARANSRLLAAVVRYEDVLEMAMEFAAVDYSGADTGGQVRLNRDFGISLAHDEELRTLLEMRLPRQKGQKAQISMETLYKELRRRGTLLEDVDVEEEKRRLREEEEEGLGTEVEDRSKTGGADGGSADGGDGGDGEDGGLSDGSNDEAGLEDRTNQEDEGGS